MPTLGDASVLFEEYSRLVEKPNLLHELLEHPEHQDGWLKLARWMTDHGLYDEAEAVATFWPVIAEDLLISVSLSKSLCDLKRSATLLARHARQLREKHELVRGLASPP